MSNLIPFSFESREIRAFNIDGNPWFVAKDVAEVLGYKNATDAIKRHCRGVAKHYPIVDSLGRHQEVRIINEPDTYRLIAGSRLPEAERFEAWLFEEVLPQIRKTGSYALPQPPANTTALAAQLAELLEGKVLVDYHDLRAVVGGALAARNVLDSLEVLAKRIEAKIGQPLVEGLTKNPEPEPAKKSESVPVPVKEPEPEPARKPYCWELTYAERKAIGMQPL